MAGHPSGRGMMDMFEELRKALVAQTLKTDEQILKTDELLSAVHDRGRSVKEAVLGALAGGEEVPMPVKEEVGVEADGQADPSAPPPVGRDAGEESPCLAGLEPPRMLEERRATDDLEVPCGEVDRQGVDPDAGRRDVPDSMGAPVHLQGLPGRSGGGLGFELRGRCAPEAGRVEACGEEEAGAVLRAGPTGTSAEVADAGGCELLKGRRAPTQPSVGGKARWGGAGRRKVPAVVSAPHRLHGRLTAKRGEAADAGGCELLKGRRAPGQPGVGGRARRGGAWRRKVPDLVGAPSRLQGRVGAKRRAKAGGRRRRIALQRSVSPRPPPWPPPFAGRRRRAAQSARGKL